MAGSFDHIFTVDLGIDCAFWDRVRVFLRPYSDGLHGWVCERLGGVVNSWDLDSYILFLLVPVHVSTPTDEVEC